eukprot:g2158.t1
MRRGLGDLASDTSLINCLRRDVNRSEPSVEWLEHSFGVLLTAEESLRNVSRSVKATRRDLRDLYAWPPGHCNRSSIKNETEEIEDGRASDPEEWCSVVEDMLRNGPHMGRSVRIERSVATTFVKRAAAKIASDILTRERRTLVFLSDSGLVSKVADALRRLEEVSTKISQCIEKGAMRWVGWKLLAGRHGHDDEASSLPGVSTMVAAEPALRGKAVPLFADSKTVSRHALDVEAEARDLSETVAHVEGDPSRASAGQNYHWADVTDRVDDRTDACSELRLRAAVDALWKDYRAWAARAKVYVDDADELCRTADARASGREEEIDQESKLLDRATTLEGVASRYVGRARKILDNLWVRGPSRAMEATDAPDEDRCSGETGGRGGSCRACVSCKSCLRDEWCGWCASTGRCVEGDENGALFESSAISSCPVESRWHQRHAVHVGDRLCPDELPSSESFPSRPEPTQTDVLHYIAPEDLASSKGRNIVHSTLTSWGRAMECERRRLEELNQRSESGMYWGYSDSETTWFQHNYTRSGTNDSQSELQTKLSPPPYCDDKLLERDIALAKIAYGFDALDPPPRPRSFPKEASAEEVEVENRVIADVRTQRLVREHKKERESIPLRPPVDSRKDNDGAGNEYDAQEESRKDEEARSKGSSRPSEDTSKSASPDAYTKDLTANDDEEEDPARVTIELSEGEFETFEQAKMYCEVNYDRLCTETDMTNAYSKQRFRKCAFGWYDASDAYVTIGNAASGGVGGRDIAACGSCGEAKAAKMSQRATYMAKYPGRMVSNTKPDVESDACLTGGLLSTNRPQIQSAYCCGVPKKLSPEKYWEKSSCLGMEHELCSMDARCCWYQPAMWRERLEEGSSCQEKDACALDDLSLDDPAVVEKARKAERENKRSCSRTSFPFKLVSKVRCAGLKRVSAIENATKCQEACCRDTRCGIWQYCESGGACSPKETCWHGPDAENCTFVKTVLSASRGELNDDAAAKTRLDAAVRSARPVQTVTKLLRGQRVRKLPLQRNGDLANLQCEDLGLERTNERPIGLGMSAPIQNAVECEMACQDNIGCGAWQWCDATLTLDNMDTHCKPLGSCWTGVGFGFLRLGQRANATCRHRSGLIGAAYPLSGIRGGAARRPASLNASSSTARASSDDRSDATDEIAKTKTAPSRSDANAASAKNDAGSGDEDDSIDVRVRTALHSTMSELLDDFNPVEGHRLFTRDDYEAKYAVAGLTSDADEKTKLALRDAFCEKLAQTQLTGKPTLTKLPPGVMRDVRRSCSSVQCIELVDYCSAKFESRPHDDGHDSEDMQWQWHHKDKAGVP